MTPERWQQIKQLFQAAIERDRDVRASFLKTACADDEELLKEVESLLAAHEMPSNLVDRFLPEIAATLLETEQATSIIGSHLGHYKIISEIGRGGMGEVYMAQDGRLGRRIAIKILPSRFTTDAARVHRFQQEARAASALNHPNIVTIHEISEADGLRFIVTEYVEGETLRTLIAHRVEIRKALDIVIQAAGALAAAHEAGITHRDIKPENIMLRPDGYVKILDFGLAKLTERKPVSEAGDSFAWMSTNPGVVMGTVSYMSPEQVRALDVDGRTDIFSLAVVLYEMIAGKKPFEGATASDVIVSILNQEPEPLAQFNDGAPVELQRIVNKALAKDRQWRYQTIRDFLIDLKNLKDEIELKAKLKSSSSANDLEMIGSGSGASVKVKSATTDGNLQVAATSDKPAINTGEAIGNTTSASGGFIARIKQSKKTVVVTIAALLLIASGIGIGLYKWLDTRTIQSSLHFEKMRMTKLTDVGSFGAIISPDGKYIAYVVDDLSGKSMSVKQLAMDRVVQLIPKTTEGFNIINFSSDSNSVYYRKANTLYQVSVLGGAAKKLAEHVGININIAPDEKRMVFLRREKDTSKDTLCIANLDGSDEQVIPLQKAGYTITAYHWSPDGKTIAMAVRHEFSAEQTPWQILTVPITGGDAKALIPPRKNYISSLVWLPDNSGLIMTAVDEKTGLLQLWRITYPEGEVQRITNDASDYSAVTITANSDTILTSQTVVANNIWVADGADVNHNRKVTLSSGGYDDVCWTYDNRILYVATESGDTGKRDIWIMSADGSEKQRLTVNAGNNRFPSMSPDGRYIAFSSNRNGKVELWRMDSDGSNAQVLTTQRADFPEITADGQWVVYIAQSAGIHTIWKVALTGGEAVQLVSEDIYSFTISPDGKQLVYFFYDQQKQREGIAIKPIEGGSNAKELYGSPGFPLDIILQWTRDGLLGLSNSSTEVLLIPLDGKSPTPVTNFKTGERIYSFAQSFDGKHIAFSRGLSTNEAILITNFKAR
jgi:serine/threonine protein kinase